MSHPHDDDDDIPPFTPDELRDPEHRALLEQAFDERGIDVDDRTLDQPPDAPPPRRRGRPPKSAADATLISALRDQGIAETLTAPDTTFTALRVRLDHDLKLAAQLADRGEIDALLRNYLDVQRLRVALVLRRHHLDTSKPHTLVDFFIAQFKTLEAGFAAAFKPYALAHPEGEWLLRQKGIGAITAGGILALVDPVRVFTASSLWRYFGYDPSIIWKKGMSRPWNATAKYIGYLASRSFVYVHQRQDAYYGQIYADRKRYITERNERGDYGELARQALATRHLSTDTSAFQAYTDGRLPLGRVEASARRYAVKELLADFAKVLVDVHQEIPRNRGRTLWPYAFSAPGQLALGAHTHYRPPPHWPLTAD